MIEALAHDLGKATPQRFGNHANASAELLREAGFGDEGVLKLVRRHHHQIKIKTQISQIYTERDLELLQLADRLASQRRSEGGTSKSFTMDEMTNQHLKLTGAYLRFELKQHFQRCNHHHNNHHSHRLTQREEYEAFKRFVQNNWWLEMVRASTTDATNKSLRQHLLLTDTIYQELLLEEAQVAQINTDAILEKTIPKIEGRPKDINLRLKIMDSLAGEQLHPYGVWKELDVGGIHRDRRFISRLLDEMEMVGILEKGDGKYSLKNGFAPKQMASKTQRTTPQNAKAKGIINEMHLLGYEADAIALEVGLPQSEVEAVLAITG